MKGRLNIFQRTMLDWNELHPYNAVHIARVPGTVDPHRLTRIVQATLESHGLTNLALSRASGRFDYAGGPANVEFTVLDGSEDPHASLTIEIEQQLNTAFPIDGRFSPFRFVLVPCDHSFFLLIVYLHAIADAESIVYLMRNIVGDYLGKGESGGLDPIRLAIDGRGTPWGNPLRLTRLLTSFPARWRDARTSCRPRYQDASDFKNGFSFISLPPDSLHALLKTAKALGATLNDLFLALAMKSLSPLAANRARVSRRRKIAFGSIVNVRKELELDAGNFGLFLGSFVVAHEIPDSVSMPDLVRHIRRETFRIKDRKQYLATPWQLAIARTAFRFVSAKSRRSFYQRYYPLWGGITNMNLNSMWDEWNDRMPMDYFRAVSTGPVTPLVLSLTTAREALNVGLSYRTTVFSASEIERVKGFLVDWEKQFQG